MDKLSYLMMILSLVILCALPLYCELKTDESLNFDVMGETGDDPEAMRVKRGLPVEMIEDSSLSKLRKRKHTEKSIKQKDDDVKTVKHRNTVVKFQSRVGKKRSLDAVSGHRQKSDDKQKNIGNKKSVASRKVRNSLQKSVKHEMKIERDGACVDDRPFVDEMKFNHGLEKRADGKTGKSGRKNKKSVKRELKINTLSEIKPLARKIDVGIGNNLEKKISKTTNPVNLSKNIENDADNDDEACVDDNGPLKEN